MSDAWQSPGNISRYDHPAKLEAKRLLQMNQEHQNPYSLKYHATPFMDKFNTPE